jgi:uncharacterized protein (TIGR02217 family)
MAHLNAVQFPRGLAAGVVYGPEFSTEVVITVAGKEKRNRIRRNALCVGECSQIPRIREQYPELLKFFRAVGGRFNTWRFKDYSDYQANATEGVLEARDSTSLSFQLCKLYTVYTGFQEVRWIQAPITSTLVIRDAGAVLVAGTHYSVNDSTGVVTFTTARTEAALSWSGDFDNVCRFDTDRMAVSAETAHLFTWGGIPIREVRL